MGYMNYYLNDITIIERRKNLNRPTIGIYQEERIKRFNCPYCNLVFQSQKDLFNHIKSVHNISKPVVVINEKIIENKEIIYVDYLNTIIIECYGKKVDVFLNDIFVEQDLDEELLEKRIIAQFKKNEKVHIKVGSQSYFIKKYSVEDIDFIKLKPIIDNWSNLTSLGSMINFNDEVELNYVEKKYLEGIYNYFIATTSSIHDKGNRYLDAYNILASFNTIDYLGSFILKIIAFRLNWVERLESLSTVDDDFKSIVSLYNNKIIRSSCFHNKYSISIYVEDDIISNINAFLRYINGDFVEVDNYLRNHSVLDIEDPNLKERIYLLTGLRAVDKNRRVRSFFNELTEQKFIDLIKYRMEKNGQ